MSYQIRHKAQKSDYYNSYPHLWNSSSEFNWPILGALTFEQKNPSWLEWLRKMAEISKLLKELMLTPGLQSSINPLKGFVDKSNMSLPPFKIEDLEIIGYTAYICEECLVSHPLTLYWHSPFMKLVPTMHKCNNERIIEVKQQIHNKIDAITALFDDLPAEMFRVVKQWTGGRPLLKVAEPLSVLQGLQNFRLIDNKKWGIRAIRDRFAVLSDEELADFLNLARGNTYAYFKRKAQNKTYCMYVGAS